MNAEIESLPAVSVKTLLLEVLAHLGAAEIQFIDSDDPIIRENVIVAKALLMQALYGNH